ncbi:unnamed protein product [Polarella glacialis]|uniref:Uncharacterized protein n=1 Tax=Polarella glacialis TaxID=89957 RepID=A0A813II65_POLGL|nr:unnamed protein product [Polarella glacialis]
MSFWEGGGSLVIAVPQDLSQQVLADGYHCSRRRRVPASRNQESALRAYRRCQPYRPAVLLEVLSLPAGVGSVPHKDGIKLSTSHLPAYCLARVSLDQAVAAPPIFPASGWHGSFQPPIRSASLRRPAGASFESVSPSWAMPYAPLPGLGPTSLDIAEIFYSQDSILPKFRDERALAQMERELRLGEKTVAEIPTITVVSSNGRYYSVDNRRLYVFKRVFGSGRIPVQIGRNDQRFQAKFTTDNGGTSVRVRGCR